MEYWQLALCFLGISFIYASVGFGGGSSYLALLAFAGLPVFEMKLTALVCNIVVVSGGTFLYWKQGELTIKKVLPILFVSVPCAYFGALISLSTDAFFILLGFSLVAAALLLIIQPANSGKKEMNVVANASIGGAIGFLSGMVGIGGGIFLSPFLNLYKWDTPKRIAATASIFILVNSISGLTAQLLKSHGDIAIQNLVVLAIAVILGGQIGSRAGLLVFPQHVVKRVTGILVLFAGIEILRGHLHF